jgi:hypothetical protein
MSSKCERVALLLGSLRAAPQLGLLALLSGCVLVGEEDLQWRKDRDGDGVSFEEDCDDADASLGLPQSWFADVDGDGFGFGEENSSCEVPSASADNGEDCDDSNPLAYPGAIEAYYDGVDADCLGDDSNGDGAVDDYDQDSDGFELSVDCDDLDATRYPDATVDEVPYNGIEDDCDLTTGDGDSDGDGYWAAEYRDLVILNGGSDFQEIPAGMGGDCWDDPFSTPAEYLPINGFPALDSTEVYPGATDIPYDDVDADCAGGPELDLDGDGYNSASFVDRAGVTGNDCFDCPDGCEYEPALPGGIEAADCNIAASETWYDGVDQDCQGLDADGSGWEDDFDLDADGYGLIGTTSSTGSPGTDCADDDFFANPGRADEWYDGIDADCGGEDDFDADGDGYVPDAYEIPAQFETQYAPGTGGLPAGDCIDTLVSYNPGRSDAWYDGIDSNCRGDNDFDADADGYSATGTLGQLTLQGSTEVARAAFDGDCEDSDPDINPGEDEVCENGIDDNCDALLNACGIDELETPATAQARVHPPSGAVVSTSQLIAFDYTGDGNTDLVFSDQYNVAPEGMASVLPGPFGSSIDLASPSASSAAGFTNSSRFGARMLAPGDLDGDGYQQLLIAAPGDVDSAGAPVGAVYFFEGPNFTGPTGAYAILSPPYLSTSFGNAMDVGDSTYGQSIAVGCTTCDGYYGSGYGSVLLSVLPPSGDHTAGYLGEIMGSSAFRGALGNQLHLADLDGDGISNVIIANMTGGADYEGFVAFYSDPWGQYSEDFDADYLIYGDSYDLLGQAAPVSADLDNDGYLDTIVGTWRGGPTGAGYVGVIQGSATPATGVSSALSSYWMLIEGSLSGAYPDQVGVRQVVGDFDANGSSDLLLAAPYAGYDGVANAGRAYLFSGPFSASGGTFSSVSDSDSWFAGGVGRTSLSNHALAGDLDNDGSDDALLGDNGSPAGWSVFSGGGGF